MEFQNQEELIRTIVRKIVEQSANQSPFSKEKDVCGALAIRAGQVKTEAFEGRQDVRLMDLVTLDEAPRMGAGIMELLQAYDIPVEGKRCVVIGRSNIVGKPMARLLLHQNGAVTICHSRTKDLPEVTRQADILVSAVGKSRFVTAEMVKPGAVVIDVGMNRDENGKLCGGGDFAAVEPVASYITPVPGGVGPMTIAMLLKNTVTAAKLQNGLL